MLLLYILKKRSKEERYAATPHPHMHPPPRSLLVCVSGTHHMANNRLVRLRFLLGAHAPVFHAPPPRQSLPPLSLSLNFDAGWASPRFETKRRARYKSDLTLSQRVGRHSPGTENPVQYPPPLPSPLSPLFPPLNHCAILFACWDRGMGLCLFLSEKPQSVKGIGPYPRSLA